MITEGHHATAELRKELQTQNGHAYPAGPPQHFQGRGKKVLAAQPSPFLCGFLTGTLLNPRRNSAAADNDSRIA